MFYDCLAIGAFKVGLSLKPAIAVELGIVPDGSTLFLALLVEGRDLSDDVGFPVVEQLVDGFQVVVRCGPPWGIRSGCLPDIFIIAHVV